MDDQEAAKVMYSDKNLQAIRQDSAKRLEVSRMSFAMEKGIRKLPEDPA